ncbi:MAG: c-type cytochrome, partial [Aureliella sp.]
MDIRPILAEYCFGCHAGGASEGSISFEKLLVDEDHQSRNETWHRVLKQLQAGLMPPAKEAQPGNDQIAQISNWIKYDALGLDAQS